MTHTKHRKRRERAEREEAEKRLENELPIFAQLQRKLAAPLLPNDPWWTTGRTGRAG